MGMLRVYPSTLIKKPCIIVDDLNNDHSSSNTATFLKHLMKSFVLRFDRYTMHWLRIELMAGRG